MFSKSDKPTETVNPSPEPARGTTKPAGVPSIISADLKVIGNLESNGDLQIDGRVEGDIHSKNVIIGDTAEIKGSVFAESVRICGNIVGEVKSTKVVIMKTAKVSGDIIHKSLSIEAGSTFEGNCRRMEAEPPAAKSSAGSTDKVQALKPSAAGTAQPAAG